ncbi:hypothetical protein ACFL0Y_02165 [Patescibacteria group bacterium]
MDQNIKKQSVAGQAEKKIVRQLSDSEPKKPWLKTLLPVGVIVLIIFAGAMTGYLLANRSPGSVEFGQPEGSGKKISQKDEAGHKDSEAFPDQAQGKIEINDNQDVLEGSHQLLRTGGESQTAYLTSSAVDLDLFIGQCVEVWGETFTAQKASWLMDIGYIKKLDKCPEGL